MINWLSEKFVPKYKLNEKEQLIFNIVQNLCDQSDTDILMAPLSGRYYIVNKRLEYWVRLFDDGVTITNHKFTFSNTSPQGFQHMLIKIVEAAIEKSRDEFERTIFQNELQLLENIFYSIKNK
jgi:hypothetical protein